MEYSSQFIFFAISQILFVVLVITAIRLLITRKRLHEILQQQRDSVQKLKALLQDVEFCHQQMQTFGEQIKPRDYVGQRGNSTPGQVSKERINTENWLAFFDLAKQLSTAATNTSEKRH